jgi:hypothetical protein
MIYPKVDMDIFLEVTHCTITDYAERTNIDYVPAPGEGHVHGPGESIGDGGACHGVILRLTNYTVASTIVKHQYPNIKSQFVRRTD